MFEQGGDLPDRLGRSTKHVQDGHGHVRFLPIDTADFVPTLAHRAMSSDAPRLRVAILALDPLARAGLVAAIDLRDDADVVDDPAAAEVALWDAGSADASGVGERLAAELSELGDAPPPLVALVADDIAAADALAAGADGVLLRTAGAARLTAALVAVHHGLRVLDPAVAQPGAPARAIQDGGIDRLTARELEVLNLLADGLSNKRIAHRLDISEHTAKFHVNSILAKLGAGTRTEAVVIAARRGVLVL